MDEGFRPSTGLQVGCPICPDFGLQKDEPKALDPTRIPPKVGEQTVATWGDVKKPGVVVFVVDNSSAMSRPELQSTKNGVVKAIDQMYDRNSVGLITFRPESFVVVAFPLEGFSAG